jgi:hypothetical protein
MRCVCCNRVLSDVEATSKFASSGEYTDMCTTCQKTLPDEVRILTRQVTETEEVKQEFYDYETEDDDEAEEE